MGASAIVDYVRTMIDEAAIARADEAASIIGPLAEQIEKDRRLPKTAVDALVHARAFKLLVPQHLGGEGAHPATFMAVVERIARADGSSGWCTMIGATSGLMSRFLDDDIAKEIYGADYSITSGVFAPMGRATPTENGYRVSGRWSFASGCEHAQWRMGGVIVPGEVLPSGAPDVRSVIFRADETRVIDTWDTSGLRGTGSHDLVVEDVVVPRNRTFSLLSSSPRHVDHPSPFFGVLAGGVAAVGLGVARAALDSFVALAKTKTPPGSKRTLAHRELVQIEVARAESMLRSARAFLFEAVTRASDDRIARTDLRLAAAHAATTAAEVAGLAYRAAGGSAVYTKNPLQRHFRDANVVTQHLMVSDSAATLAGRSLLELETDMTML